MPMSAVCFASAAVTALYDVWLGAASLRTTEIVQMPVPVLCYTIAADAELPTADAVAVWQPLIAIHQTLQPSRTAATAAQAALLSAAGAAAL